MPIIAGDQLQSSVNSWFSATPSVTHRSFWIIYRPIGWTIKALLWVELASFFSLVSSHPTQTKGLRVSMYSLSLLFLQYTAFWSSFFTINVQMILWQWTKTCCFQRQGLPFTQVTPSTTAASCLHFLGGPLWFIVIWLLVHVFDLPGKMPPSPVGVLGFWTWLLFLIPAFS